MSDFNIPHTTPQPNDPLHADLVRTMRAQTHCLFELALHDADVDEPLGVLELPRSLRDIFIVAFHCRLIGLTEAETKTEFDNFDECDEAPPSESVPPGDRNCIIDHSNRLIKVALVVDADLSYNQWGMIRADFSPVCLDF